MCSQQRIRIGEFFRDFDKLRTGFITNAQFRIGLNMAKVGVSNKEYEQITSTFKAPKEGEHICWKDFVDHVDEVFTKKGMEKNADTILNDVRTSTTYGRREANADELAIV